jgi:uncharacterized protein YukE
MAPKISVQPEALSALADELAGLASALAADGIRCRTAAGTLDRALGGHEGEVAGVVATGWGVLAGSLAEGAGSVAGTLQAALRAYDEADAELAQQFGPPEQQPGAGSC